MTRKKVLIVDDQNAVLILEKMMLREANVEVLTAKDGDEAVAKAASENPDLVLLDVVMPRMNGIDACRAIRDLPRSIRIPIIMVTTRSESTNRQAGFDAGCDEYLTKPFNAVELLNTVRRYLQPA